MLKAVNYFRKKAPSQELAIIPFHQTSAEHTVESNKAKFRGYTD